MYVHKRKIGNDMNHVLQVTIHQYKNLVKLIVATVAVWFVSS